MTPAIQPPVDTLALVVEPAVNAIALPVQALGALLPACLFSTIRSTIQPPVNAITLLIQTLLDTVAAIVELLLSSIARVRHRTGAQQKSGYCGET
jgi:hypothetical protein